MTILFFKLIDQKSENWKHPVRVLPNIWRLGKVMDTKFGTKVFNKMLLNAAKFQVACFYLFWVIRGKPTEVYNYPLPHPQIRHLWSEDVCYKFSIFVFCLAVMYTIYEVLDMSPSGNFDIIFFNRDSLHARLVTKRHRITRKKSTYTLKNKGNLFRKNLHSKRVC